MALVARTIQMFRPNLIMHRLAAMSTSLTQSSSRYLPPLSTMQTRAPQFSFKSYFSTSANNDDFDNEFGDIRDCEPSDLDKKRKGLSNDKLKYLIVDVREPDELENNYNLGPNFKDWVNIPQGTILNLSDKGEFEEVLAEKGVSDLEEYQDIYFMCRGGVRSMNVSKHVVELDIDQQIFNVTGGIKKYDQDVGLDTLR